MMLLTAVRDDGDVVLVVVLEDENVARIKENDPVEIKWKELPWKTSSRFPHSIVITHADPINYAKIMGMAAEGRSAEAMILLCRGWRYRPECGDHDLGPTKIGPGKEDS